MHLDGLAHRCREVMKFARYLGNNTTGHPNAKEADKHVEQVASRRINISGHLNVSRKCLASFARWPGNVIGQC